MKDNFVKEKSYGFALLVVRVSKILTTEQKEFVLSKQLLRSDTSIGANIEEATGAVSKKNFIAKSYYLPVANYFDSFPPY